MIKKLPEKYKQLLKEEKLKSEAKQHAEMLKNHLYSFRKEFNKHLTTFVTGAFAFVAALLWRDAITYTLTNESELIANVFPFFGEGGLKYVTAFIITIVAVVAIIIISRLLKTEEEKK